MVTFTKLFEIRMVANNRSESFNKALIRLSERCSSASMEFKSEGESEKKAISDADTKPEAYSRITTKHNATIAPIEGGMTVTPSHKSAKRHKYESGSKEYKFN